MSRRDDVRAILRASWDGVSTKTVAQELGVTYDTADDDLRKLRKMKQVERGENGLWYWMPRNGIVPDLVQVRRLDPDVAAVEEQVLAAEEEPQVYHTPEKVIEAVSGAQPLAEPEVIRELADHLDRLSVVPAAELERPAPPVEHMVVLKLKVPASVARRILELVP